MYILPLSAEVAYRISPVKFNDTDKIATGDKKSIGQRKYYRAMMINYYGEYPDSEWADIRNRWGEQVQWAKVPPFGTDSKEFAVPDRLAADYETVFFWNSANAESECIAN